MKSFKGLKLQDKIATVILYLVGIIAIAIALYDITSWVDYHRFKQVNITPNNLDEVLEEFHITNNPKITLKKIGYDLSEGEMYLLIEDVENIHDLYFKNLSYFEYSENEFQAKFNTKFENFSEIYSAFNEPLYKGVTCKMKKNSEEFKVSLYKKNEKLYCEMNTKLDYTFIQKIIQN